MASYFNLILDTTAPASLDIKLNDDAKYTASTSVTLSLELPEGEETTGYQMKIWGSVVGAADEESAEWETYQPSKTITLTSGDETKIVSVKVRDAVGNETAAATDTIILNTAVPVVSVTGPDVSVISKVAGFDSAVVSFTSDVPFVEYKVCVVPATNSLVDAGTVIADANGSENTSGVKTGEETFAANEPVTVTVKGKDIAAVSAGDGTKIVKIFVKNAAGTWSVA